MQFKKRIEKLGAELLPNLERIKQQLLQQQQEPPAPIFKQLTPEDYKWRQYTAAWIRKQNGTRDPWAEAVDRYHHKSITKMLKEKYQYTDSAIADYWAGIPHSHADRARRDTDLERPGASTEPPSPAETVATPAAVPATTSSSTLGWPSASFPVGGWVGQSGNDALNGMGRQIQDSRRHSPPLPFGGQGNFGRGRRGRRPR
jgi:hypothetical protein